MLRPLSYIPLRHRLALPVPGITHYIQETQSICLTASQALKDLGCWAQTVAAPEGESDDHLTTLENALPRSASPKGTRYGLLLRSRRRDLRCVHSLRRTFDMPTFAAQLPMRRSNSRTRWQSGLWSPR